MNNVTGLGNKDLVRIVLFFCSNKEKEFSSSTRLQKLVFLAQNKFPEFTEIQKENIYIDDPFVYTADNYGPFSLDLLKLTKILKREEELSISKGNPTIYTVTQKLEDELRNKLDTLKNPIVEKWINKIATAGSMPLDQLLRYVYQDEAFQKYLLNSKIRSRY